jgi:hypothetical protein
VQKLDSFFEELLADLNNNALYSKTGKAYTKIDKENMLAHVQRVNAYKEVKVKALLFEAKVQRIRADNYNRNAA